MNCPCCGSKCTEHHGKNPGDYGWFLCRECGFQWEAEEGET